MFPVLFPDFFRVVWSECVETLTEVLAEPYEWEVEEEEEEEVFWLVVEVGEFPPTKTNKRTIKVRSSERELFLGISGFMFE